MVNLAPLTITLNDVDVTNCYVPDTGAVEITDSLNQPVTCAVSFSSLNLPTPIQGGELLTVRDSKCIYFDGIVPVEGGVGAEYLYLDTSLTPEAYRKMVKATGADYQSVLDYKNLPERVFYDQKCGAIIKTLIELTPLAGLVDYTDVSDGYQVPMYYVGGRKFSNVVKELATVNGYYFSLRTAGIGPTAGQASYKTAIDAASATDGFRVAGGGSMTFDHWNFYYVRVAGVNGPSFEVSCPGADRAALMTLNAYWTAITSVVGARTFKAEFRCVTDRPAPFTVDRDAMKYELATLKMDPRANPLVNRITVTGGVEPSDDVQTDEFMCDDDSGQFLLSKVPFCLKTSELFTSDFSQAVADMQGVVLGFNPGAFTTVDSELQMDGNATFCFVPSFQSRDQRYTTFEEIMLDAGCSFVCGLFANETPEGADCKLGVWFKADGTITYINNGVEGTPVGNPTWSPRTVTTADNIYSVRVKQTTQGTMCEIQGGDLSPVRHWLPMLPPGDHAFANMTFRGVPHEGATIDLEISGVTVPTYTLGADDAGDATLWTLHENLIRWIGSVDALSRRWWVTEQSDNWTFSNVTRANPAVATLTAASDINTGDWIEPNGMTGSWAAVNTNRYKAEKIDSTHVKLIGLDSTGFSADATSGWVRHYHNGIYLWAFKDGSQDNLGVLSTINPNNRNDDGTYAETIDHWLGFDFAATVGTDRGADFGALPDNYFAGLIVQGSGTVHRIIARDPVGVDVQLERSDDNVLRIMQNNPDLVSAQKVVSLTVGSGDEVAESFSAQVTLDGNTATLSFFDDEASLPQAGDIVRVTYRYGVPLRVTVQDHTSVNMVKAQSKIPGDDGIREGQDIDLTDKVFSSDSAVLYGTQYLATRSGLSLQGSVQTDSIKTLGGVPLSGQSLAFAMTPDGLTRQETVSQVIMRHKGIMNAFDFTVAFGNIPDEFLLPTENPNIRNGPDAFTYNVQSVVETVRLVESQIKLTVVS